MKVLEFVERLAAKLKISREAALGVYRAVVDEMMTGLAQGEEIKLEGLGKLVSYRRSASQGRPMLQSEINQNPVIEVEFQQFRSSRSELIARCPFTEEIHAAERTKASRPAAAESEDRETD